MISDIWTGARIAEKVSAGWCRVRSNAHLKVDKTTMAKARNALITCKKDLEREMDRQRNNDTKSWGLLTAMQVITTIEGNVLTKNPEIAKLLNGLKDGTEESSREMKRRTDLLRNAIHTLETALETLPR